MENFENNVMNCLSKKGLVMGNEKHEKKIAKCVLNLYNKINGTNFKSKAPKIIIMKIDLNKSKKKVTA